MFWNIAKNKNGIATLLIYGSIGDGWFDDVSSEEVAKDLEALGDLKEINVRINSPGGSVFAGVAIYNTLKNNKAKVNIIIDGLCASIATIIAMAGDTITMGVGSTFMIHNPLCVEYGNSEEMRKTADVLDVLKVSLVDAYMTKVKISREEVEKMMTDEAYLTAETALEKGFITSTSSKDFTPTNAFDLSHFKNFKGYIAAAADNIKKNKEEEKMTRAQFEKEHPEMFKEIKNEGVLEERNRIKALDDLGAMAEAPVEIFNAKYTEIKSVEAVALDILKNFKNKAPENTIPEVEEKLDFLGNFVDKLTDSENVGAVSSGQIDETDEESGAKFAAKLIELANEGGE